MRFAPICLDAVAPFLKPDPVLCKLTRYVASWPLMERIYIPQGHPLAPLLGHANVMVSHHLHTCSIGHRCLFLIGYGERGRCDVGPSQRATC